MIDRGRGDIVKQQSLKTIMQQQIQQLDEIELIDFVPGAMENAALQQLKKELEKKIRKKSLQVKQGRALDVNAPMLNGYKELLRRLTTVQAAGAVKRDRQEIEAREENLPSRFARKGKGEEVKNSLSKVQNCSGVLTSVGGGISTAEEFVNAIGESGEEHTRKKIQTGEEHLGGLFGRSGISRGQAHIPVIVLDDDSMDGAQQAGIDDNDTTMRDFGNGDCTGTSSRDAEPDQEMADTVPAPWRGRLLGKAPLYQFGGLEIPAGMNNAGKHIPAIKFGTPSPLGFGSLRGIGPPMKSETLFTRSGTGPAFGSSEFGANSAEFVPVLTGKGASSFGVGAGTGGERGTSDSPILIEDSD